MTGKRVWEVTSACALVATLLGIVAGSFYLRARREYVTNALLEAMNRNDFGAMRQCTLEGADVRARCLDGRQPITLAAIYGKVELVQLLLERGANPNAADSEGMTPLMYQSSLAMCRLLVEHGADVNARSQSGRTPLTGVIRSGDAESRRIVQFLLERGAQPSLQDLQAARSNREMAALIRRRRP